MYENFDTNDMTVNELREILSQRGLSTKGKKTELKVCKHTFRLFLLSTHVYL